MIGPHLIQAIAPAYAGQTGADGRLLTRQNPPPGVVVLEVSGTLTKRVLREVRDVVNQLAASDAVRQVLIIVDSPGGTLAGTHDLHLAVRRLAAKKHVTVAVEDLCASAALWAFCGATELYVNATGSVGSIGVFIVLADASRMFEKLGVDWLVIRSGKFKGAGVWGAKVSSEQVEQLQGTVDTQHRHFVAALAQGRGMTVARVTDLADGRLLIGEQAVAAGLADGVACVEEVLEGVAGRAMASWAHLRGAAAAEKFNELLEARHRVKSRDATWQRASVARAYPELAAAAAEHEAAERERREFHHRSMARMSRTF